MRSSRPFLVFLLLFDVWYRGHTFGPSVCDAIGISLWPACSGQSEPLDCDEAAYAYIGHRILRGDVLYRDLTENKPPLGYWLYTLGVAAGGYRELAIRIMAIPYVLATLGTVWWIAGRLGGPVAASLAGALYAILSTDPFLFGNGSNLEHFINLFATVSLALLIAGWDRDSRWWIFGSGVSLGAAVLIKQVAIVHAVVFVPALLYRGWTRAPAGKWRWFRAFADVLAFGSGAGLIAAIALAILVARGALQPAVEDIVLYGRAIATDTLPEPSAPLAFLRWLTGNADPKGALPWPFGSTDWLVWWATGSWPLWLASVPALLYLLFGRRASAPRRLVAGWTAATWIQVGLPGMYWQHYYLLPICGVAIAVALALGDASAAVIEIFRQERADGEAVENSRRRVVRVRRPLVLPAIAALVLAAAVAGTVFIQARDYLGVAPEELTIRYKGGRQWVVLRELGRDVARRATIWEEPQLYVWGWQSPLYFYSRLDSPTRHFFVDNLLRDQADRGHPLIQPRTSEIIAVLARKPPELIFTGYPPFRALDKFLNEHYLPSRRAPGLWIRRGDYGRFERAAPGPAAGRSTSHDGPAFDRSLVDQPPIALAQAPHDRAPALGERISAGGFRHPAPLISLVEEPDERGRQAFWRLGGFDQNSGRTGLDDITDASRPESHHGQSRCHRLEHDVAEGLGQARKREDVGRCVVVGQVIPLAIAGEVRERANPALQCRARRPVADQKDSRTRPPGRDECEGIRQIIHVFLGCDPADIGNQHIARCQAEGSTHLVPPGSIRPEERAIDTPLPQHHPLESAILEVLDRRLGRYVGLSRAVVEPSQVAPDDPPRPAEPVMMAVLVEVGVEARDDVQPPRERESEDAQTEGRFGGDMHHVGSERVDLPVNRPERRQWQMELLVKGKHDRRDKNSLGVRGLASPIIGMDHLDRVAAGRQVPDQLSQGPRYTVDLRKVRFSDDRDPHRFGQSERWRSLGRSGTHPGSAALRSIVMLPDFALRSQPTWRMVARSPGSLALRRTVTAMPPGSTCRAVRDVRNSLLGGNWTHPAVNVARQS
jgi:4-amino-4-deoxy-L-arabinose transferase-like glycosyltransferase